MPKAAPPAIIYLGPEFIGQMPIKKERGSPGLTHCPVVRAIQAIKSRSGPGRLGHRSELLSSSALAVRVVCQWEK
jgi:hypothetical protein